MLLKVAAYALNNNLNTIWIKNVKEILNTSGFSYVWDRPEIVDRSRFLDELRSDWFSEQFIQSWHCQLLSESGKLRTYKLLNITLEWRTISLTTMPPMKANS